VIRADRVVSAAKLSERMCLSGVLGRPVAPKMNALGDVKIGAVIKSENRLHDRDALWIVVEGRRGQDRHERAYLGATGEG
jgi:hypothetical protein